MSEGLPKAQESVAAKALSKHLEKGATGRLYLSSGSPSAAPDVSVYVQLGELLAATADDDALHYVRRLEVGDYLPGDQADLLRARSETGESVFGDLLELAPVEVFDAILLDRFRDNLARFLGSDGKARFEFTAGVFVDNLQMGLDSARQILECSALFDAASGIPLDLEVRQGVLDAEDPLEELIFDALAVSPIVGDFLARLPIEPLAGRARVAQMLGRRSLVFPSEAVDEVPVPADDNWVETPDDDTEMVERSDEEVPRQLLRAATEDDLSADLELDPESEIEPDPAFEPEVESPEEAPPEEEPAPDAEPEPAPEAEPEEEPEPDEEPAPEAEPEEEPVPEEEPAPEPEEKPAPEPEEEPEPLPEPPRYFAPERVPVASSPARRKYSISPDAPTIQPSDEDEEVDDAPTATPDAPVAPPPSRQGAGNLSSLSAWMEQAAAVEDDLDAFSDHDEDRGSDGKGGFSTDLHNLDRVEVSALDSETAAIETEDLPQTKYGAPTMTDDVAFGKLDVANETLKQIIAVFDESQGMGAGVAALQLLLEGAPAKFAPLFEGVQMGDDGDLDMRKIIRNLHQRPPSEHRRLITDGLTDLIDRALSIGADELPDEAIDEMLERTAGYRGRMGF